MLLILKPIQIVSKFSTRTVDWKMWPNGYLHWRYMFIHIVVFVNDFSDLAEDEDDAN